MNKYEVQEIIGEGTYGIVVKALNKETNEIVAIKKFKENARSFIKRELKMLNTLKSSEFIINLKEAFKRNEKIYFIFEYVERTVLQLLTEFPNGISQNVCKSITFQLCKAIEKCHSLDIIHRDVKPENLLIDRNYQLKLCDFGFARPSYLEESEVITEYVATRWYRSPELLLICPYNKSVDVWAIGCMVCEMTNGRPVFEGKSDLDQLQKIKSSMGPIAEYQLDELLKSSKQPNLKIVKNDKNDIGFDRKFGNKMNEKLFEFTKKCLTVNPDERLQISECVIDPAFETNLKVFMSKSAGQDVNAANSLKFREIQKNDKRELKNLKTFSMREPLSRSNLSRANTSHEQYDNESSPKKYNNELKPRYLASRLKLSMNQTTPQPTTVINSQKNDDQPLKPSFPVLSNPERYNSSIVIRKQNIESKNELYFQRNTQLREPENQTNKNERTKGEINRSVTMMTYGNQRSYQTELKNKELRTSNFIKLLKNRHDASNLKNRSKSTIETYRNAPEMNVTPALNSSINVHNNQELTTSYAPYQTQNTFNKYQNEYIKNKQYSVVKTAPVNLLFLVFFFISEFDYHVTRQLSFFM